MLHRISVGEELPSAVVAQLENGSPKGVPIRSLGKGRNIMLVGMPGAFTPICSRHHIPNLIQNQWQLQKSGVDGIYCVTVNDPWVMQIWAASFGTECAISFLSDSNHDFLAKCGLLVPALDLYLGMISARFAMIVRDNVVARLSVESKYTELTCTSAEAMIAIEAIGAAHGAPA